jgi:hypothetical protein
VCSSSRQGSLLSNRSWTSGTLIKVGVADFLNDIGKEAICLCLRRNLVDSFASLDFFPRYVGTKGEGLEDEEDEEASLEDDAEAYDMVEKARKKNRSYNRI